MTKHSTPPETPESKRGPECTAIAALHEWAAEREGREWEIFGPCLRGKLGVELFAGAHRLVASAIAPDLETAVREALEEARAGEQGS